MIRHSNFQRSAPDNVDPADPWMLQGACKADPDAMYPSSLSDEIEYAKSFCQACPVIQPCRERALDNREEFGVWGGLSEAERRALLRRRGIRLGPQRKKAPANDAQDEKPVQARTGRKPAECGTRSAYQRHVKNKEPIDDACRRANTAADSRLRRTGTTKAAA